MRAKNLVLCVLAVSVLGLPPVVMADDKRPLRCSNKTLKGTYQLSVSGWVATGADTFSPEAYAGFISYDGLGNIVLKKTYLHEGAWDTSISTGFYSIGSDCVGVATYPGAGQFSYFVAPDGESASVVKISNYAGGEFVPSPDQVGATVHRISKKIIAQPPG